MTASPSTRFRITLLWKASKLLSLRGLWQPISSDSVFPPRCEKHPSCYLYGGCDSALLAELFDDEVVKSIQVVIFTGAVTANGKIYIKLKWLWKASKLLSLRGLWQQARWNLMSRLGCEKHPSCYLYGGCDSQRYPDAILVSVVKSIQVVIFTGAVTATSAEEFHKR